MSKKLPAKNYVVLIGDAAASRKLAPAQRRALQDEFRTALKEVNRKWEESVAAGFAVTAGDQFQGLLHMAERVWEIAHWLRAELRQVDWIIACARGPITTPLGDTALEVDGPCFHQAARALETAKRERLVFAFAGFDPALMSLARYYSALYWSWTARQRQVATVLRVAEPDAAARALEMSPSALSHVKGRMAWKLVAEADGDFRSLLERP